MTSVLVVRLDSMGDVLMSGPAVRAASASATTSMLVGPLGAPAAALLPGVQEVLVWDCPWISAHPPTMVHKATYEVIAVLAARSFDEALILTSFHQSALPTALLLRLAGIPRISAISEDYPGRLLDVRVPTPPDGPEPVRMLAVAQAAGYRLPAGDDGLLAVRRPLPDVDLGLTDYVVIHPGVSAPARAYPATHWKEVVRALTLASIPVVVTGSRSEWALTAMVAADNGMDCGGQFDLPEMATVLAKARVVVAANTGPAHLAAAVGTPVVSLFAPVVPVTRWAPYGVVTRVLGRQGAACRDSRAVVCAVEGHPCLSRVSPAEVVTAAMELAHSAGDPLSFATRR